MGAARPRLAPRRGLRRGLPAAGRHHRRRPSRPGGAALPALGRSGADRQLHPHSDTAAIFSGAEGLPQPRCAGKGPGSSRRAAPPRQLCAAGEGGQADRGCSSPSSQRPPADHRHGDVREVASPSGGGGGGSGRGRGRRGRKASCGRWRRGRLSGERPGKERGGRCPLSGAGPGRAASGAVQVGRRGLGRPPALVGALRGAAGVRSVGAGGCAARYPPPLLPSVCFEFVCMSMVGFGRKRRIPWSDCPACCGSVIGSPHFLPAAVLSCRSCRGSVPGAFPAALGRFHRCQLRPPGDIGTRGPMPEPR